MVPGAPPWRNGNAHMSSDMGIGHVTCHVTCQNPSPVWGPVAHIPTSPWVSDRLKHPLKHPQLDVEASWSRFRNFLIKRQDPVVVKTDPISVGISQSWQSHFCHFNISRFAFFAWWLPKMETCGWSWLSRMVLRRWSNWSICPICDCWGTPGSRKALLAIASHALNAGSSAGRVWACFGMFFVFFSCFGWFSNISG